MSVVESLGSDEEEGDGRTQLRRRFRELRRSERRLALGLDPRPAPAEPLDLEENPEKYGYINGKSPLERAEEDYLRYLRKLQMREIREHAARTGEIFIRDQKVGYPRDNIGPIPGHWEKGPERQLEDMGTVEALARGAKWLLELPGLWITEAVKESGLEKQAEIPLAVASLPFTLGQGIADIAKGLITDPEPEVPHHTTEAIADLGGTLLGMGMAGVLTRGGKALAKEVRPTRLWNDIRAEGRAALNDAREAPDVWERIDPLAREAARLAGGGDELEVLSAREASLVSAGARGHMTDAALERTRAQRAALERDIARKMAAALRTLREAQKALPEDTSPPLTEAEAAATLEEEFSRGGAADLARQKAAEARTVGVFRAIRDAAEARAANARREAKEGIGLQRQAVPEPPPAAPTPEATLRPAAAPAPEAAVPGKGPGKRRPGRKVARPGQEPPMATPGPATEPPPAAPISEPPPPAEGSRTRRPGRKTARPAQEPPPLTAPTPEVPPPSAAAPPFEALPPVEATAEPPPPAPTPETALPGKGLGRRRPGSRTARPAAELPPPAAPVPEAAPPSTGRGRRRPGSRTARPAAELPPPAAPVPEAPSAPEVAPPAEGSLKRRPGRKTARPAQEPPPPAAAISELPPPPPTPAPEVAPPSKGRGKRRPGRKTAGPAQELPPPVAPSSETPPPPAAAPEVLPPAEAPPISARARPGGAPIFDERGRRYTYHVRRIPIDRIVASNLPSGAPDPRYERGFQTRDFSLSRARHYAERLDPEKLAPEGSSPAIGSEVVWLDDKTGLYHVVAGNHRHVARLLAGGKGTIDVRVLDGTREQAREFSAASQRTETAPEGLVERGRALVGSLGLTEADLPRDLGHEPITPATVQSLQHRNPQFVSKVLGPLGILDADTAAREINSAIVGLLPRALQDAMSQAGIRTEEAIAHAAPGLLDLHRRAVAGEIRAEYDLLSHLGRAANALERAGGKAGARMVARLNRAAEQPELPGMPRDPVRDMDQADAGMLLGITAMASRTSPAAAMAEAVARLREIALDPSNSPRQQRLFAEDPAIDQLGLIRTLFGERVARQAQKFRPAVRTPPESAGPLASGPLFIFAGAPAQALFEAARKIGKAAEAPFIAARDVVDSLGIRFNPKLARIEVPALGRGVKADDIEARRLLAIRSAPDVGRNMGQSTPVEAGITSAAERSEAARVIEMKDVQRRLAEGQQQAGWTPASARAEELRARGEVDPRKMAAVEDIYAAKNKEILRWLVEAGKIARAAAAGMDPATYFHHLVIAWKEGDGANIGGTRVPGESHPSAARRAIGSRKAVEPDVFTAQSIAAAEAFTALANHDAVTAWRTLARNLDIRAAGPDGHIDFSDVGLYDFGAHGKAEAWTRNVAVERFVREALARERLDSEGQRYVKIEYRARDPETGQLESGTSWFRKAIADDDPFVLQVGIDTRSGRPILQEADVLPNGLVRGLIEAGKQYTFPGLWTKGIGRLTALSKGLYLNTLVPNVRYQVQQVIQDAIQAGLNLPLEQEATFARNVVKYAREVFDSLHAVETNKWSPHFAELARQGMITGTFWDFLENEVDATGSLVNRSALPALYRKWHENLVQDIGEPIDKMLAKIHPRMHKLASAKFWSNFRETVNKLALRATYEEMGASRLRATSHAHTVLGNYWKVSPMGRLLAPVTQFSKWFIEAGIGLLLRSMKDPVTGEMSLRGAWSGPWPKLLIKAGLVAAWNAYFGTGSKDADDLIAGAGIGSGRLSQGVIIPGQNEDGSWTVWHLNNADDVFDGMAAFAEEALAGSGTLAGRRALAFGFSHTAPALAAPVEWWANRKRSSGAPIESEAVRRFGLETQKRLNYMAKGLPLSNAGLYLAEQLGGYPLRLYERIAGRERTGTQLASDLGVPLQRVTARGKMADKRYDEGDVRYQEWVAEREKGANADPARLAALVQFARSTGLLRRWLRDYKLGKREARLLENMTPEERRDYRLRRMRVPEPALVPAGPVPPFIE